MLRRFFFYSSIFSLLCLSLACGPKDKPTFEEWQTFLIKGQARGHASVSTGAQLGGRFVSGFEGGPSDTSFHFDGDINFMPESLSPSSSPAP